ncbi:uncharacterized protein LOC114252907 [Bombyx mandarina]|uniref:Uncharacterized protein LOC114252907 n=1 Tax=Bombyx mandarina TaxID=7092 RepID=A0A6J2KM32_BOMMA|nr:uncharacterized protein LOC114252907 [Bombyx mandarina]XP_028043395.1 uncharacterized protein LOC114252907 [Bombyx mandarina]XP_028043396.1 uncharacterized protein LOC114252907 [Bombyx mandarina]XP_028043397.1 uncharacterized protein LOC114252907 [Bombyx mandarina]
MTGHYFRYKIFAIFKELQQIESTNQKRQNTARRLFASLEDVSIAETSQNIPQQVLQVPNLSPPPPTLSHTPSPLSMPIASPSRRGTTTTAGTSSRPSVVIRPRRNDAHPSTGQERPILRSSSPISTQRTPYRRGTTGSSSRSRARISREIGSSSSRHRRHAISPPSQRRAELTRITERFLRVEEQQVEIQQVYTRVVQGLLEHSISTQSLISTGHERLVEIVTTIGERIVDRLYERERLFAEAALSIGQGLKALAEAANAFKPPQ